MSSDTEGNSNGDRQHSKEEKEKETKQAYVPVSSYLYQFRYLTISLTP